MQERPSIGSRILSYYFFTILVVFFVLVVSFNLAVRIYASRQLKDQLNHTKEQVDLLRAKDEPPSGEDRQSLFDRTSRSAHEGSAVRMLFMDQQRVLTVGVLNMQQLREKGNRQEASLPARSSGIAKLDGVVLRMGPSAFGEAKAVLDYVQGTHYNLEKKGASSAYIQGRNYLLQSIPFAQNELGTEYVLAYVSVESFEHFSRSALQILSFIMIPILILSFFVMRALAKALARPIVLLEGLSRRFGSGAFVGEDFHFREKELHDLNEALNDTAGKLKTYHDNQTIFFQNVSHELRTPLTSSRGYAEAIEYGVFDPEIASRVILKEAGKLERLVDDILYLSRIETHESLSDEMTEMALQDLLMEAWEGMDAKARLQGISLRVDCEPSLSVKVYFNEILRALTNVLSNALRYAKKEVMLRGTKMSVLGGPGVCIEILDDGPGVVPGEEEAIFRRFVKGPGGQNGIGLSIAQAAVMRHGGTIRCANREQGGAVFMICLPQTPPKREVLERGGCPMGQP